MSKNLWQTLAESQIQSFNVYGPTECTVDATVCRIAFDQEPSLGQALPNVAAYVLDADLNPVPIEIPGELCIAGDGIARGYCNAPAATAAKFVADPFSLRPGARLYRTGDRVRRLPNGNIEFLGRIDNQLKIRGFRVEPGEVASVLEKHPAIRQCVVAPRPDAYGDPQLVAYVILDPKRSPLAGGRQRYRLPNKLAVVHLNKNETDFLYEEMFQNQAYFKHGITVCDGDCVFDVGANIGLFSLSTHLRAKNLRIYAFEPSPIVFDLLRTNMKLYGVDATLFPTGVSSAPATTSFTFYPKFSFLSGLYADREDDADVVRSFVRKHAENAPEDMETETLEQLLEERFESKSLNVTLVTLSGVIRDHSIESIDLLKINVEKSEMDVLAGIDSQDWPKIRQVAMEVHDIDGRLESIACLLRRHGYEVRIEQDWQLEESTTSNYYVYARRLVNDVRNRVHTPLAEIDPIIGPQDLRIFAEFQVRLGVLVCFRFSCFQFR